METKPPTARGSGTEAQTDIGEENSILFIENLPEATTTDMLVVLFKQFPGMLGWCIQKCAINQIFLNSSASC